MATVTFKAPPTAQAWHITDTDSFGDWAELVQWCRETEGVTCTMCVRVDGSVYVQVEGVNYDTLVTGLDRHIVFDGLAFKAYSDEEFAEVFE